MEIRQPCIITPRLLPGLQIGDAFVSIEYGGTTYDNRQGYRYYIDLPRFSYEGEDIASGVGGGSLQSGLKSLLSFLGAFAESIRYQEHIGTECESTTLFPPKLADWATQNSDEITMLGIELEESEEPVIVE